MKNPTNHAKYEKLDENVYKQNDSISVIAHSEESEPDIMWLNTSDASALGAEDVASRLRVEVRQGLSWQEATHRRQLSGTPQQEIEKKVEQIKMKEVLKKFDEIKDELKMEFNKQLAGIKTEFSGVKGEILKMKVEWDMRSENWQRERAGSEKRINDVEVKLERQEKDKRGKNIMIKGVKFESNQPNCQNLNLKQRMAKFMLEKTGIEVELEEAYRTGKPEDLTTIAKCESLDKKTRVLE
ncbi:hypothetical protein FQA39_LY11631 [Lamprigera yunnana]|nr:hypothetical protein FQA39_LY11631 [Lamprigera yunnana]